MDQQSFDQDRRLLELEQHLNEMQGALGRQAERLRGLEDWAKQVSSYYLQSESSAPRSDRRRQNQAASLKAPPIPEPAPGPAASWNEPGAYQSTVMGSAEPSRTRRSEEDLESIVGGSWLNRVGAVALVLGLAFFLKLAVDHGWITHWMQVGFGLLLGGGLIAGSEQVRRRGLAGYSHGLSGAGFAALYISIYSAYGPYQLIGFTTAFALLAGISAATVARAVALDAEVIAALGTLCGFLTPIVLSGSGAGGDISYVTKLFIYIWILDAAVLAAACFKDWGKLKLGSLLLTQVFFGIWLSMHYTPVLLTIVTTAATGYFILFIAVSLTYHVAWNKDADDTDIFVIVENPLVYACLMAYFFYERSPELLGVYSLALAALYAGLTLAVLKRRSWTGVISVSFLAVSVGFLTGAAPLLLGGEARTAAWSAEALVLFCGGCAAGAAPLRSAAYALYTLLAVNLAYSLENWTWSAPAGPGHGSFFTMVELPFALTIVSALLAEWAARYYRSSFPQEAQNASTVLAVGAYLAGFVWLTAEVFYRGRGMSDFAISGCLSVAWSLYAAALLGFGMAARRRSARIASLCLLAIVIAKVFLLDIWLLESVYRVVSLFVLAAVLWAASYLYSRYRDRLRELVLKDG